MKLKTERTLLLLALKVTALLRLEAKATTKIAADFRRPATKTLVTMTPMAEEEVAVVAVAAEVVEVAEVVGVVVAAKAVKVA